MVRENFGVLGKNARAMYCWVFVGSTEKRIALFRVVHALSWSSRRRRSP
jgi:hypothetical protein